ncbi:Bicarbonate transport ATP-binding protein CmpD [bacterium HR29]|nr:Bicarbonate transport ATP-binding protein CmpD [bacterium HR29]
MPAIELHRISHTFAGTPPVEALREVSLTVEAGEFASIVGPSGCGKTTILRILAGLIVPTAGEARIGGRSTIGRPGLAAYMPQRDLLLPWRRALENATLGAEIAGMPRGEARRRALELFEQFGLRGFERAWPAQLSGGMRQRLALLRTFLLPFDAILLDEPFGALDAITRRTMHAWLQDVWLRDRRTVLFVTHDVEEALMLADTVYIMTARPGRIAETMRVPFARPRPLDIVADPRFAALKERLLETLDRAVQEG